MKIYSLASGSSGNCTYVESNQAKVLIDAGVSCKKITQDLKDMGVDAKSISSILVTHEHIDHIKGIRVFSKKYDTPVYATDKTWEGMESVVTEIAEKNKKYLELSGTEVDDLKIETFSVSHDAMDPIGFCMHEKNETFGMATDTGYVTSDIKKHLTGADFLFIEANHDIDMLKEGSYPGHLKKRILSNRGHLSNIDAGMGLTSLISGKTKKIALAHLSADNNTPDLAKVTVERILDEVRIQTDVNIANRGSLTDLYNERKNNNEFSR